MPIAAPYPLQRARRETDSKGASTEALCAADVQQWHVVEIAVGPNSPSAPAQIRCSSLAAGDLPVSSFPSLATAMLMAPMLHRSLAITRASSLHCIVASLVRLQDIPSAFLFVEEDERSFTDVSPHTEPADTNTRAMCLSLTCIGHPQNLKRTMLPAAFFAVDPELSYLSRRPESAEGLEPDCPRSRHQP